MLNVLSPKKQALYEKQIQSWEKKSKPKAPEPDTDMDSDDICAFIAGYTPGGAPYGVTRIKMKQIEGLEWKDAFSIDEAFELLF